MKIKNFYACDDFFKPIIQAYIIAFCMHHQNLTKIDDLQTWLSYNNWPNLITQVEKEYLSLEKVQSVREGAEMNILAEVAIELGICK